MSQPLVKISGPSGEKFCVLCPRCDTICSLTFTFSYELLWSCGTMGCDFTQDFDIDPEFIAKIAILDFATLNSISVSDLTLAKIANQAHTKVRQLVKDLTEGR